MTAPGLFGDFRDTCVSCLVPVDTGLAVEGEAEFVIVALGKFGIDYPVARDMIGDVARDRYGCDPGMVPAGDMRVEIRVCRACAARAGMVPSLLAGSEIVTYRQPDELRRGGAA
jgi:hypothetical protein